MSVYNVLPSSEQPRRLAVTGYGRWPTLPAKEAERRLFHSLLHLIIEPATLVVAYLWLRDCKSFHRVVDRFREHGMHLFDVASLLAAGSSRALSPAALKMLEEEVTVDPSACQG